MTSTLIILCSLLAAVFAQTCREPNKQYPDPDQCDKYIQCVDGVAEEKLCPDGLVFDDVRNNTLFPCGYQTEVDCGSRTKLQPARPTQNCGRSWGYFSSGDSSICEVFFNCVDGVEYQFTCPEGLAFNSLTYACDWPEDAPDCDAAAYLGFSCPAVRDELQLLTIGIPRYASPRDCSKFFLCVSTHPRLQTCELGTVFNDEIHGCDEPENVRGCETFYPKEELAAIRERKELARLAQEKRQREYQERFARLNNRA